MTKRAQPVDRPETRKRLPRARLATFLKGFGAPVGAAAGAAILGAVGFWFEPARDMIRHWLWKEHAVIEISVYPSDVRAGEEFDISVIGRSLAPIAVSQGLLRLQLPEELHLMSGRPVVPSPSFSEPTRLEGKQPLKAFASKEGRIEVAASFETSYGTYRARQSITVHPPTASGHPSRQNYSGRWAVTLGYQLGYFTLIEHPPKKTFTGEYLVGSEKGVLDGWHDGKTFSARLYRGDSPTQWLVDSIVTPPTDHDSFELQGEVLLRQFEGAKWISKPPSLKFKAAPE